MTQYDPQIIITFADRLYAQARGAITTSIIIGFLLGGGAGLFFGEGELILALIGAVILGAGGYWQGQGRAFKLKLQAQTALCQAKIEANTRV